MLKPTDGSGVASDVDEVGAPAANPYKGRTGLIRIAHAYLNSMAGLADAWRNESAFRQEVVLAAILIAVACFVPVSAIERAMLIAAVLQVMIVELLNTGIEVAIDRISLDRHPLSKRAKDMGSAAVFLSLVLWAVVWGLVLVPRLA